jgi:5-oxoprolinase (ATP-hydrolysing)
VNCESKWKFWVDRGGTFTDVVACRPDGALVTHKLLSEDPEHYSDPALQGIRQLMGLGPDEAIPAARIEAVKMGTTIGTNALLERTGERVALAVTCGFRDLLRIGYQNRPNLFALNIALPELLYETVLEVDGRVLAEGQLDQEPDWPEARRKLQAVYESGIRSLAIVLMHAYRFPEHEKKLAVLAKSVGFEHISSSHEVSSLIKIVGRGDTAVVDAYLSPLLKRYIAGIRQGLGRDLTKLFFMQSHGGLTDERHFRGKDSILSGPAGGIVGAVKVSRQAGFRKIISFDMGGTSTDVAHYDGELERGFENEIAGVRLQAPMLQIHTVAAGGGSILHYEAGRLTVGPDSAGANPGPACYRRGGPLTVTDCNVMLGRLLPDYFPRVFGPRANEALDTQVVADKFADLADRINGESGGEHSCEDIAEGFLKIAVENMATAIKHISVHRGYNVKEYTLCCFGGAGGQHACQIADLLEIDTVFLHPFGGVLSAYGMGLAEQRTLKQRTVATPLCEEITPRLETIFAELEEEANREMSDHGSVRRHVARSLLLRYDGTETSLLVDYADVAEMNAAYARRHQQRFGFIYAERDVVVEAAVLELISSEAQVEPIAAGTTADPAAKPCAHTRMVASGGHVEAPIYRREEIPAGASIPGPAIIIEPTATIVVEPDWQACTNPDNHLVLKRVRPRPRRLAIGTSVDPIMLEIFNNRFMSIAEQMGFALQNSASSVNIRERLDFSCAVFDQHGGLVANAPHIPVHLGSMADSVASIHRQFADDMSPGDAYLLNSPYHGGTHLPDITVITPVFGTGERLLFYVASRGHHADVGGRTPGSMPPDSTRIDEEGVLCTGMKIVSNGSLHECELRKWLGGGIYPARNPDRNLADLRAQIAANTTGVKELLKLVDHYSLETVLAYMGHVMDNAEEAVRRILPTLREGTYCSPLDRGGQICVSISVNREQRTAVLDFTGTSERDPQSNFNTPSAVTKAAVLYVLRCLVEDEIPLNSGCLKPIRIVIPEGSLLDPQEPCAVVAGNVETSQVIVDTLLAAAGVLAASQGTMNNLTFGNERYQYYETICGGSGAGADFAGTSAVQTHMTNSRITDPEVLELRFPVVLERFAIRRGSGGQGRHPGGDGVVRRLRFLEPMTVAILSGRRQTVPFGLQGGQPGLSGKNWIVTAAGMRIDLAGCDSAQMTPGDAIVIETPGGGGNGDRNTQVQNT